jgi:glyoxylase-like metal-dependent hydrolase (beta-lactamase superfamily II)
MILVRSIFFFVLLNAAGCYKTIMLESLIVTQVQDASNPDENSNAYVVSSMSTRQGFFVDTGATNSTTAQLISAYQQQVQSLSKPPQFVFLTHGHPDHASGIALIQRIYRSTPIYVISQQVAREAIQWINFSCENNIFSGAQCNLNYTNILRVLTSPRSQLSFSHPSIQLRAINNLVKGESSYAGLLGLTTSSGIFLLFTGDSITIRSHLFVSNFFENQALPGSDDVLCSWAGYMQASACEFRSNRRLIILPGHGPLSHATRYAQDIALNIAWIRALRKLTFNSCNSSYVWAQMIRQYPDFVGKGIDMKGALNTHVPANANSVGCRCNNGFPTVCPVYNAPPTCPYLDIDSGDATLSCNIPNTWSSFNIYKYSKSKTTK